MAKQINEGSNINDTIEMKQNKEESNLSFKDHQKDLAIGK